MKKKILLLATCLSIAAVVSAQKGIETGTPYGFGEDSIRCGTNIALFIPYATSGNFKDAYPFWKLAYEECPRSHIGIYQQGVKIMGWLISEEADPAKKEELINDLMKLYDNRVKYFGDRPGQGKDYIVRIKAQQYSDLKGENTDHQLVYQWLSEVLDEFKEQTEPLALSVFMFSSYKLMQGDTEKYKEQYINDFIKVSAIFEEQQKVALAANNETEIQNILAFKWTEEQNFAKSGVAECDILESYYAPKVEENKTNLDYLKTTMNMFRYVRCEESDLFITASEYAYKIEPTSDSALGLAKKAIKDKDYATAEKYINEAIAMTDDSKMKADLYYSLATIAYQRNQFPKLKQEVNRCLAENPNYGKAHLLLATAYAQTYNTIYPNDPVLTKCVFYAVVDRAERAKQVDPSVVDDANKMINTYKQYFPSTADVFMHNLIKEGETFTIGGWINETVRVR